MKKRSHYLSTIEWFNLNLNLQIVCHSFGYNIFLVGSALKTREFRDVDLRYIVTEPDEFFDSLLKHPTQKFIQIAISEWLSSRTGLTVDFQFQTMEEAEEFNGDRIAMGITI